MSPVLPKESHHGDQLRRNRCRGRGVNLASTIIWHAVEFSRIGRTPSPARQGRSRGNSSNLADSTVPVKPGTLDSHVHRHVLRAAGGPERVSRQEATGRPPSPASRSPRAELKPTVAVPATSSLPGRDTRHTTRSPVQVADDLSTANRPLTPSYDYPTPVEQVRFPDRRLRVHGGLDPSVVHVGPALGDRPPGCRPGRDNAGGHEHVHVGR